MSIGVKRFKAKDGREGSYASLGNGLIKLLYDDGDMAILREIDSKPAMTDASDDGSGEAPPHAEG